MAKAVSTLALLGLAIPLAACGGTESTETAAGTTTDSTGAASAGSVGDALRETLAAGSARFTITLAHTSGNATLGAEEGESDSTEGTVDFAARRTAVEGDSEPAIVDESAFYVQPRAEGETRWLKFDLAPEPGQPAPPDVSLGRLDVVRQLEYVASIGGSFAPAGEEEIAGVATRRYRGYGDAEGLMHALVSDVVFPQLPWSTHGSSVEPSEIVPFDVWVGEDGRVQKVEYDFPNFDSYVGDLTTIELRDFGAGGEIEIPDAEEATGP